MVGPSWVGISSAGLYQINLTVPTGLGEGEVPIRAMIAGIQTQAQVWFSLELDSSGGGYGGTSSPVIYGGGPGFGFSSGTPGFGGGTMGGGSGGGSGGGGSSDAKRHHKKQWHPRLTFPPK